MKDEDRKILTEFLGECWHEWERKRELILEISFYECRKCGCHRATEQQNRTFDTWEDFGVLWVQASNSTSWCAFFGWTIERFSGIKGFGFSLEGIDWIIDKDRFPFLILEAIKEGILR